ncbi:hypothetical protein IV203_012453 [Nitzschia inconspicua]|uniref:Uncharacterized protein n=1 Tax=Nitzschia inconspicua TaxID=303405 RepID=A0A9K3PK98_9STRA|nr:hypothetical protein IV203_012453 [Nitzschia inconspicua]
MPSTKRKKEFITSENQGMVLTMSFVIPVIRFVMKGETLFCGWIKQSNVPSSTAIPSAPKTIAARELDDIVTFSGPISCLQVK